MGSVYRLTLRQLSGRWRLLIMSVLATLPMIITALMVGSDSAPSVAQFEQAVLGTMLAGAIIPLVVLAIATAAFGNEVEDQTLANLTLSSLPRWQVVVAKLLGTITVAAPFIAVSAAVTSWIAFLGDPHAVAAVTAAAVFAVALYAAAFLWLGLVSTQAIGLGLLYIVLWEGFFSGFVAGVRLLSIRHYAIGLAHAIDARRFIDANTLGPVAAVVVSAVVFGGFTLLTVRRLRRMDVP